MKRKFFAIAATAVICLLFTTAYAYNAVDGEQVGGKHKSRHGVKKSNDNFQR